MAATRTRKRLLWWIAGADQKILAECPEADQIFVQHLGISLSIAFFFVLFATSTAALVALPNVSPLGTGISLIMAFLVACSAFLIDRIFIQADWEWQAKKQHDELAAAAWAQKRREDDQEHEPGKRSAGTRTGWPREAGSCRRTSRARRAARRRTPLAHTPASSRQPGPNSRAQSPPPMQHKPNTTR